ncbi:MAG: HIT domain-containing protein [Planctomycetota bacterium]|nr:HIT domain-containing protein [Planctomycetota bacterium]
MARPSDASSPSGPRSAAQPLMAPWRLSYMDMLSRAEKQSSQGGAKAGAGAGAGAASSFLRAYWLDPAGDEANHVIVRTGTEQTGRGGLILLNRYPYANGHLLVCLGEARSRVLEYDEARRAELWSLVDLAVHLVERGLEPQGVNVGLNQGAAAGAGVPGHIHVHVVPRWAGDVNFMEACAQIRVIPSALEDMARRMREVWRSLEAEGHGRA